MTAIAETIKTKELGRFARFLIVGAIGTLLDFSLLTVLKAVGLLTLFANTISFSAGVVNNFTWNRIWTFADAKKTDWRKQLAQFSLVSLIGLVLNNTIVLILEVPFDNILGGTDIGYFPAKVIATGVVVFWNYFANRFWTFKSQVSVQMGIHTPIKTTLTPEE